MWYFPLSAIAAADSIKLYSMNQQTAETRIKQNKDWRQRLDDILQEMKVAGNREVQTKATVGEFADAITVPNPAFTGTSRHRSLSITHLEDSIMRLGMDCKEVNEACPGAAPNPYPTSYDKITAKVEPTADDLKL